MSCGVGGGLIDRERRIAFNDSVQGTRNEMFMCSAFKANKKTLLSSPSLYPDHKNSVNYVFSCTATCARLHVHQSPPYPRLRR